VETFEAFSFDPMAEPASSVRAEDHSFKTSIWPNPYGEDLHIAFTAMREESLMIRLVDPLGRTVYTQLLQAFTGFNQQHLHIGQIPDGVYFFFIDSPDGPVARHQVVHYTRE
jgi:hypothetical protein